MTYVEQVKGAKSPLHAMLVVAGALDDMMAVLTGIAKPVVADEYDWGAWSAPAQAEAKPLIQATDVSEGERVVKLAPPTESKQLLRKQFAEGVLKLGTVLGDAPAEMTWAEAYAKGGPLWLYTGNRDVVMTYPLEIRAAMVADVEEDDPHTAQEMGRDVLKQPSETGPGGVAMQMGVA